tara:strand:- start:92 stop:244 length:153 start_codon:yes stop_codon:yes gene_type:complete
MSFGGSNGSTGVSAHVHNSDIGEGGNLSSSETNLDTVLLSGTIRTEALVF